jgi:starch-binding outer membrane protein, SusD/RagB family
MVANSQPGEVWDLIEEDLRFAKANLPAQWDANNVGRATKWAAAGMLGKVRLYRAQWEGKPGKYAEAITEFNEIVNSGPFQLMADYGDNFRESHENNAESLFEIQMTRGDFNPWLPTDFGMEQNQNVGSAGSGRAIFMGAACHLGACAPGANAYGYGQVHITTSLQSAFEPGDPRRHHTYYNEGDDYAGTPFSSTWSITGATPSKYMRPFPIGHFPLNIITNNERILRYSDVLLMLAEAELLGNGNVARAAQLINQVRQRARGSYEAAYGEPAPEGILPDRPAGVGVDQMMRWLMHERRVELALEVHRYDDLVRWHRANLINIKQDVDFGNTIAQGAWDVRHLLKPVPQGELDNNANLVQNPGY